MKIVGVREVSGTSKETGRSFSGVKLYYTEPCSRGGFGFITGSAYFGGDSADVVRSIGGDGFLRML